MLSVWFCEAVLLVDTLLLHCNDAADYDAPVAENGDLTEKYFIIQKVLRELLPNSEGLLCLVLCLFVL